MNRDKALEYDAELLTAENSMLQEERFELGYRLGLAEGITAALNAICDLKEDFELDEDMVAKLRNIRSTHSAPIS